MAASPKQITTEEGISGRLTAVSIALRLMSVANVRKWDDMPPQLDGIGIELRSSQRSLIERHETTLYYLRNSVRQKKSTTDVVAPQRTISIAECNVCTRWMLLGSSAAPAKCSLTLDCEGSMIKAKSATYFKPNTSERDT